MRALSACLTVVLGLGVAAMAACSSTSSDDTSGGGTAGAATAGTSAGGTSAGTSSGGTSTGGTDVGAGGDSSGCAFLDGPCGSCFATNCADDENTCTKEAACDAALTGTDGLIACACGGDMTIAQCATTFGAVDDLSKAVTACAKTNCATECGL